MSSCCIKWCGKSSRRSNYKTDGITFHRFPKDPKLKQKWIELTRRENWFPSKTNQVCSSHFTEDCFHIMKCGRRRLYDTAIPTKNLPLVGDTTVSKLNIPTKEQDCPKPSSSTSKHQPIPTTSNTEKQKSPDTVTMAQFGSPIKKRLCRRILELSEKVAHKNKLIADLRNKMRYFAKRTVPAKDDLSDTSLISDPEENSNVTKPSVPRFANSRRIQLGRIGQIGSVSVVSLCTMCLKNITSFRYRCLMCPDYEMCGECERLGGHHDDHYVLRVPMQRPTVEVDQVESAVKRALTSFPIWDKAFKSTAQPKDKKKKQLKKTVNKPGKTNNSGELTDDTGNDSEDVDEPTDTEKKPEITSYIPGTIKTEAVVSDDEPVVKVELVIKEEMDPLEETEASDFQLNIYEHETTCETKYVPSPPLQDLPSFQGVSPSHIVQAFQGVPSSNLFPPIQRVPTSHDVPPSKRRRDDDHHFTTTTPTSKESTELCAETSSSSTVTTSSTSGSKVDVFVLKKRTRPEEKNDD